MVKPKAPGNKDDAKAQDAKSKASVNVPVKKPEQGQKKKEEKKVLSLEDLIKNSFELVKSYRPNFQHPSKEGVKCETIFEVLPDITNIIQEYTCLMKLISDLLASLLSKLKLLLKL